jgi:hypothetical protein
MLANVLIALTKRRSAIPTRAKHQVRLLMLGESSLPKERTALLATSALAKYGQGMMTIQGPNAASRGVLHGRMAK